MPIYDVHLSRKDAAAEKPSLKVERISAASAWEATSKAIKIATEDNPDWADATVDNTDVALVARN